MINKKFLVYFIILFLLETFIAIFIHDNIIRPYIGDILVIILIYCFILIFTKKKIKLLPLYLFIFSIIIELLQYINILKRLRLEKHLILRILIGTTFDIKDIICYGIGMIVIFLWQKNIT